MGNMNCGDTGSCCAINQNELSMMSGTGRQSIRYSDYY